MALSALISTGYAVCSWGDGLAIGAAHGQDTNQYGLQLQLDRRTPLREWSASDLRAYALVGVGEFQGRKNGRPRDTVRVLGATGVLRWERHATYGVKPFLDFGFGIGGVSERTINGNRDFGGKFEFNELVQAGIRFGSRYQYEFNVRGQHFSNAGINPPNDGMTYAGAGFTWYWN